MKENKPANSFNHSFIDWKAINGDLIKLSPKVQNKLGSFVESIMDQAQLIPSESFSYLIEKEGAAEFLEYKSDEFDNSLNCTVLEKVNNSIQDLLNDYERNNDIVSKAKILNVESKGAKILENLIEKDVVEDFSDTEIFLKSNLVQKENIVRELAKGSFNQIWSIFKVTPRPKFQSLDEAIIWLNESSVPFKLVFKINPSEIQIDHLIKDVCRSFGVKEINELNEKQFKSLSRKREGQKLKRAILERRYGLETSTNRIVEKGWRIPVKKEQEWANLEFLQSKNILSFDHGDRVIGQEHQLYKERKDWLVLYLNKRRISNLKKLLRLIHPVEDWVAYRVESKAVGTKVKVVINDREVNSLQFNSAINIAFNFLLNKRPHQTVLMNDLRDYVEVQLRKINPIKMAPDYTASIYASKMGFNMNLKDAFIVTNDKKSEESFMLKKQLDYSEIKTSFPKGLKYKSKNGKIQTVMPLKYKEIPS